MPPAKPPPDVQVCTDFSYLARNPARDKTGSEGRSLFEYSPSAPEKEQRKRGSGAISTHALPRLWMLHTAMFMR